MAADLELRAYYAAFLGLFAVVELYERAVPLLAADVGISAATLGVGFGVARAAEIIVSPVTGVVADARDRAAVAAVAAVSLGGGMSLFLLPVLALEVGLGGATFLALFAGASVAAAPLSVAGGVAADRRSRKRLYVGNYAAETLMLLAFGLAGGSAFLLADGAARPFAPGPALFLAGPALFVVQTAFEPAVLAYFFDQFPDERAATAWSVEGTVSKAAGVVAPVAGGLLFDVAPGLPFLAGAALLAVGTAVAVTLPNGRGS